MVVRGGGAAGGNRVTGGWPVLFAVSRLRPVAMILLTLDLGRATYAPPNPGGYGEKVSRQLPKL